MVAEIGNELLLHGVIVISRLQGHQPFELLLSPSIDFWPFNACEGDGNSFDEGGESWDIIVNEEIGGKFSEKALSFRAISFKYGG